MRATAEPRYSQHDFNLYTLAFLVVGFALGYLADHVLWQPAAQNEWNRAYVRLMYCNGATPCKAAGDR